MTAITPPPTSTRGSHGGAPPAASGPPALEIDSVGEAVGDGLWETVGVLPVLADGDGAGDPAPGWGVARMCVGLGVAFAVGLGVGLGVGFAVGLGVGLAVGFAVGLGVGLAVGFAVGLGVGLGAPTVTRAEALWELLKQSALPMT